MRLYLRGNVWWARWTEGGRKLRRSSKTTHRDEAETTVAGWGRKVDVVHPRPPRVVAIRKPILDLGGRTPGLVYFVSAEGSGRIKIGFTQRDVEHRMRQIQNGCPYPVALLATLRTRKLEELHFHKMFAADRVMANAEWFHSSPDIQWAIERALVGETVCPRCTGQSLR